MTDIEIEALKKALGEVIEELKELDTRLSELENARNRCDHARGATITPNGALICDSCHSILDTQALIAEMEHHELVKPTRDLPK